jgi:hypothetical protein
VTDTSGLTSATSVSIFPPENPILPDTGDPGTSSTGGWLVSDEPWPHGVDSLYSRTAAATYTYDFDVPQPGEYRVLAWWTVGTTRDTQSPPRSTTPAASIPSG